MSCAQAVLGYCHLVPISFFVSEFKPHFYDDSSDESDSEDDSDSDLESEAKMVMAISRPFFIEKDKDGDGFITLEEMKQAILEVSENLDDKELEKMVLELDEDGDGKISFIGKFF